MKRFLPKINRTFFIKRFLIVSISLVVVLLIILLVGINVFIEQQKILIKENQNRKILSEKYLLDHLLDDAILDLNIMAENQLFRDYYTNRNDVLGKQLESLIKDIFIQKEDYYQLRFLDSLGMEVFRIGRENGNPKIADVRSLQDKSQRYYFKESMLLKNGGIYISPFDLNVEHEMIENPIRPMIRICTPVFDQSDNKLGVNILNFDGTNLLRELKTKALTGEGESYLINKQGYFLNAPDTTIEWGFMYDDKKDMVLEKLFPEDYQAIMDTQEGQFERNTGLFTVSTTKPLNKLGENVFNSLRPKDYSWKLVLYVPKKEFSLFSFIPIGNLIFLFVVVLLTGLIFAYLYSNISLRRFQAQQGLLESEKNLRKANQTKDQFFSIISHDLKNSSGSISGYLSFMNENFSSFSEEEKTMHFNDITFAASQHNKLLHEILDWVRLQQGNVDFKPIYIPVVELFEEQKALVELNLKNKNLTIQIESEKDVFAYGDKNMLKTILRNLINNAIKFSNRDDRIILSALKKAEQVELRVIDFGIGMKTDEAAKIFEITSRIQNPGTENEPGTGFGLKLVAELVAKNNGTIRVESDLGKGSSFILSFPSGK